MIIKERTKPTVMLQLEALLRRLPAQHRKRSQIEADLARYTAGYNGEKSIDYHLSFLPEKEFFILHDLRLPSASHFFQMDTLILHANFILILEVKNISGTLVFDQNFHQLIRRIGEKEEAFPDPFLQAARHKKQLQQWLATKYFNDIPLEFLVVISSPSTLIKMVTFNQSFYKKIVHSAVICDRINELLLIQRSPLLEQTSIRRLSRLLQKNHTIKLKPVLEQYQLKLSDCSTGVYCPSCLALPMNRIHGKWVCRECTRQSEKAYLSSLEDYFLLTNSPAISNKEFRSFLNIHSKTMAFNLLSASGLKHVNARKSRVYLRNNL
ncbi:NERD domain-containing protein [Metabacillus sp. GX 13764]|uniref:nuclease-related domain-containing protein n=1 Tax=Metabacillus kandeliae TaxID=2900151 RepID=UPI001E2A0C44|nr:nuclease-related domain-containing protein [Metabacillus kandeliae]MCD7035399.1 NERD domain-containing protein [Metabacillus kandeliae]